MSCHSKLIMKKVYYTIGILFIILFNYASVFAQSTTEERLIEKIKTRKLKMLNDYIDYIGNNKNDISSQKFYAEKALALFVNNGEDYECNDTPTKGALLHLVSAYNHSSISRLVKDYFKGGINMRHSAATIIKVQFAVVSKKELENMVKTENGQYRVTCYIKDLCGIREGRLVYQEIAQKRICLYIDESQVDMITNESPLVLLLDVYATERPKI